MATLVLMIGTLSPAAQAAMADDADSGRTTASAGEIAGDILLIRPAGVVMSIFGAALFIPTAILSAAGGWDNVTHAYELLILEPFDTTFRRPLGGP
jgi:hypothetical protein